MWVYKVVKTVCQVASVEGDSLDKVLIAELTLNWIGLWKRLGVGPSATAPDDRLIGEKVLYIEYPTDEAGPPPRTRIACLSCVANLAPRRTIQLTRPNNPRWDLVRTC